MGNNKITDEQVKEAIGYEEVTDCCSSCQYLSKTVGKCTLNPCHWFPVSLKGICMHFSRIAGESDEKGSNSE